jgi:hypothetical protein
MKNWRYVFGMRKLLRWTLFFFFFFNCFLYTLPHANSFTLRLHATAHLILLLQNHFLQNFVAYLLYSFLKVHHKHYMLFLCTFTTLLCVKVFLYKYLPFCNLGHRIRNQLSWLDIQNSGYHIRTNRPTIRILNLKSTFLWRPWTYIAWAKFSVKSCDTYCYHFPA